MLLERAGVVVIFRQRARRPQGRLDLANAQATTLAVLLVGGTLISGCAPKQPAPSSPALSRSTSSPRSGAPTVAGAPARPCETPSTLSDLPAGIRAIVEATFVPGRAVPDQAGGVTIPLQDVKVIWSNSKDSPTALVEHLPVSDADVFLDADRYILLLGENSFGNFYLVDGRYGAFAFADSPGANLVRMCTVYSVGPKASPPVRSVAKIGRQALLALATSAAQRDADIPSSVPPVPIPSS
jgi:hypothetical protein